MTRTALMLVLLAALAGCSLRGPYRAPDPAAVVVRNADPALFSERAYDARWWRQFDDPVLEQLESDGLQSNHDNALMKSRIVAGMAEGHERGRGGSCTV